MRIQTYRQTDTDKSFAATTATDVLPAVGVDLSQVDRFSLILKNTGANSVAITITYTLGALTVTDTTTIGTINAGATKSLNLAPGSTDPAYQNVKISGTSASGTTVSIEAIAVRNTL